MNGKERHSMTGKNVRTACPLVWLRWHKCLVALLTRSCITGGTSWFRFESSVYFKRLWRYCSLKSSGWAHFAFICFSKSLFPPFQLLKNLWNRLLNAKNQSLILVLGICRLCVTSFVVKAGSFYYLLTTCICSVSCVCLTVFHLHK